jgi:predicted CopG family antitoxin
MTKNISISEEAYERLAGHKGPNESFTEVIKRVVPPPSKKPITYFLGTWKGTDEEFKSIDALIRDMWNRYDSRLGDEPRSASTRTS